MTLRVLDTEQDADAIMIGVLMNKLGLARIEVTDADIRTLAARINNGAVTLVVGGDRATGNAVLSFVDSADMPNENTELQ